MFEFLVAISVAFAARPVVKYLHGTTKGDLSRW